MDSGLIRRHGCFVLLLLAGCAAGGKTLDVSPVSGTVTMDGQPLADANVTFLDTAGKNTASGKTDASGKYKLAYSSFDGAVPGSYKVIITHYVAKDGSPLKISEGMDADQLLMQGEAKSSLHESITSGSNEKLKAEVKKGEANTFDWKLKADGTVE